MNFFQGPFYSADGTEDHGGDDDVDAVVRNVFHILGETDDESIHFDVRMIDLFLEKFLLEKRIDFDDRQLTFRRVKFEIVSGTGSDFEDPQNTIFPQFRIGRFVILHLLEMFSLQFFDRFVVDGAQRCVHRCHKPVKSAHKHQNKKNKKRINFNASLL